MNIVTPLLLLNIFENNEQKRIPANLPVLTNTLVHTH